MSLDLRIWVPQEVDVCEMNITHNLNVMAERAGIYKHVWRPEEIGITEAGQLIEPLQKAIADMRANPAVYKAVEPTNGWGTYTNFVLWLERLLRVCQEYPEGRVEASR